MAYMIKYGSGKTNYSGTEPCRVCHGTGRQKSPRQASKKPKKNKR